MHPQSKEEKSLRSLPFSLKKFKIICRVWTTGNLAFWMCAQYTPHQEEGSCKARNPIAWAPKPECFILCGAFASQLQVRCKAVASQLQAWA